MATPTTTSNPELMIDAQDDITGLPADLAVLEFDRQGHVEWNKALFAANVYEPTHLDGRKVCAELKDQKKRPLNGHFAFWLKKHQDQIPEEWKSWEMLFMGVIITHVSFIFHGPLSDHGGQPELTCAKLWFEGDEWKLSVCNFSSYPLKPNHRVPLLP